MADVVVTLPVREGDEAQLFGKYLNRFMESRSFEAEQMAESSDAPYLMMHSDPYDGHEVKRLIFQENSVASDFSSGWANARTQRAARMAG
ncbi:MAG: hypothetical protein ACYDD1_07530 [Caulobacteraceae bacterium]